MIRIFQKKSFLFFIFIIFSFLFFFNLKLINEDFVNIQYKSPNVKYSNETNDNEISSLNNDNLVKDEEKLLKDDTYIDEDIHYIKNYKGGEIEPEWEWVKNISIVYTWVDGLDIDFLDLKSKYNGGSRTVNSRYRSADELRYSIRSLEKYLPWYNGTIYILTNNQIPKWLDISKSRIKVVYHKDIFPEHIYPTFDSNTIELFLDKIPGITEQFIYFNDDIFINNYIHPSFFFTSKTFYPKIYRGSKLSFDKSQIRKIIHENNIHKIFQASKFFTTNIIKEYFDNEFIYHNLYHSGYVFYRDLFEPFRQLFKEELKILCSDRMRNPHKLQVIYLYHAFLQYGTQNEKFPSKLGGKGKSQNFLGYKLPSNRTIEKYSCKVYIMNEKDSFIKFGKITDVKKNNNIYFNLFKTNPNILIYNFNDNYSKNSVLYQFIYYMMTRYPEPSSFEKEEHKKLEQVVIKNLNDLDSFSKDVINTINSSSDFYNNGNYNLIKFKNTVEDAKLIKISKYIENIKSLDGPQKEISEREREEINFLLSYNGEALEDEWKWAENMSVVYIIENNDYEVNELIIEEIEKLKYSLRSLEKYLPWLKGKIYIITQFDSKDEFSWINNKNKRLEIINPSKIIPAKYYGVEIEHFAEIFIDRLPGISERFIYLKSNHYFINYTHPRFFFSKEFFPKYNFEKILEGTDLIFAKIDNELLYESYKIIINYFGDSYVRGFRLFRDMPCSLYRDLFEPSFQLYKRFVDNHEFVKFSPFYLVSNYNIYGTDQPYYPEFVMGYDEITKIDLPILNKERTIKYYGYDITSQNIFKNTVLSNEELFDKYKSNEINNITEVINNSNKLFFSLKLDFKDVSKMNIIENLMGKLYKEKSSFES